MNQQEQRIQDHLVTSIVEEWASSDNPFNDIVYPGQHVDNVASNMGEAVDANDVKYVLKLTQENHYFPKRGNSQRITKRAIDHARNCGVNLPFNRSIQQDILQILIDEERKNVDHPEVGHDELKSQLSCSDRQVDFNLFYCQICGWVDVETYIERNNWNHAVITPRGREQL